MPGTFSYELLSLPEGFMMDVGPVNPSSTALATHEASGIATVSQPWGALITVRLST